MTLLERIGDFYHIESGGEMHGRKAQPAESFWHSHIYESENGWERLGWEGILDPETVQLSSDLLAMREKYGVDPNSNELIPSDNERLRAEFKKRVIQIITRPKKEYDLPSENDSDGQDYPDSGSMSSSSTDPV